MSKQKVEIATRSRTEPIEAVGVKERGYWNIEFDASQETLAEELWAEGCFGVNGEHVDVVELSQEEDGVSPIILELQVGACLGV
ncbi:hypothetical protein [Citricoccus nitrophenolicus]|uniref:hypothetical protein n=1 Tax=Citricoccus nitrophenolicus TaxID=863575 RepID=UPI0031EE14D5